MRTSTSKEHLWREFESKVAAHCERFFPEAKISRNERIRGQHSGQLREIDIAIRQKLGLQEILIVIDCKHYGRPVDIKTMEAFCALKSDVAANAGMVISNREFTKAARKVARNHQVTTYRYIDGDAAEFPAWIWMPLMVDVWWLEPKSLELNKPDGSTQSMDWVDECKIGMADIKHTISLRSLMVHSWECEKTDQEGEYNCDIRFVKEKADLNCGLSIVYGAKLISAVRRAKLLFSGFADRTEKKHTRMCIRFVLILRQNS